MADKKIEDAARVASVGGTEILPASVGGAAKSLTTEQVKTYVMDAIATLSDITDWDPESGEAMAIRTTVDNATVNRYVPFDDVVLAVFNALVGKTAVTTLSDEDVISISNGSDAKTVTVGALKTHVSNAFSGNMDIHGLTAADSASTSDELAAYQSGSVNANRKVTVSQLATAVCPKVATEATASQTAISSTDALIIARAPATPGGSPTLEKVPLQNAGIASGNLVLGPNATTQDKIPQWSATSRTLADGLALVTDQAVTSQSTDTAVPTAKSVYKSIKDSLSVESGSLSGNVYIPALSSTSDKKVRGYLERVTSMSSDDNDFDIPTSPAVKAYVEATMVTGPSTPTQGKIPFWSGAGKSLSDGRNFQNEAIRDEGMASDYSIPSERAVRSSMAGRPANTTEDCIPQWDEADGVLKNGLSLVTSVTSGATNAQIPSAAAVYAVLGNAIHFSVDISTARTQISDLPASGYGVGDMLLTKAVINSQNCYALFVCYAVTQGGGCLWAYVSKCLLDEWPSE